MKRDLVGVGRENEREGWGMETDGGDSNEMGSMAEERKIN